MKRFTARSRGTRIKPISLVVTDLCMNLWYKLSALNQSFSANQPCNKFNTSVI